MKTMKHLAFVTGKSVDSSICWLANEYEYCKGLD